MFKGFWKPPLLNENEDKLIIGCVKGDRFAQNKLYEKYSSKMFAVCFRYSRNREDAEDTFHEGFMKVFENIQHFKSEGSFEGWIRRIMVNTAINKYKKTSNLYSLINIDDTHIDSFDTDDIYSQIGVKELINMVRDLPPRYQMVFNLYVFEGLKHKEIAEQLDISEGTSKSNLSDARSILQRAVNNSLKIATPTAMGAL
jgi:RNA polymerase sigma-70 factor (ECF subfamily)